MDDRHRDIKVLVAAWSIHGQPPRSPNTRRPEITEGVLMAAIDGLRRDPPQMNPASRIPFAPMRRPGRVTRRTAVRSTTTTRAA